MRLSSSRRGKLRRLAKYRAKRKTATGRYEVEWQDEMEWLVQQYKNQRRNRKRRQRG